MLNILVLGVTSYDDIIQVDRLFDAHPQNVYANESYSMVGSTGSGKAIALKRLGFDVNFICALGDDEYAKNIKQRMQEEQIALFLVEADKTERHTNIMDSSGNRISIFTTISNNIHFNPSLFETQIKQADIVCLNIKPYCKEFIPLLYKYNKTVWCDLHDYDIDNPYHQAFIEASDVLFLSSDRLPDYKTFMKRMIDEGKKLIVVTHGSRGASLLSKDHKMIEIDANSLEIIDTNGAGDNFFAGFLYGYINQFNLKESLLLGKYAASSCVLSKDIVGKDLSEDYLTKKLSKTRKNS